MEIELINADGITLKTKGKYCSEDVDITPKLQAKTTTANGQVTSDDGYVGLKEVTVNVQPNLQAKEVTPSESQQIVTSDSDYDGLSQVTVSAVQTKEVTVTPAKGQQVLEVTDNKYYKKVTVEAIPDDYVIPSGTIHITENGIVDVSGKANANVDVPTGVDTNDATAVSGDILQGKTAYAKGVKLTGSVETYDGTFVVNIL